MTQSEIKEMAKNMVGDGQSPNKYFVTYSPTIEVVNDYRSENIEYEYAKGFDESDQVIEVFDTYEDAIAYYENIDLDQRDGVCCATIEDRMAGTVRQKILQKVVSIEYSQIEYV